MGSPTTRAAASHQKDLWGESHARLFSPGFRVSNFPSPVAGFNTNIAHRGAVFHLQTEDSGAKNPRIVTHLFADGGRILRTLRIDYKEHVDRPDLHGFVRSLMRSQHKNLFLALRSGELDTLIEQACGPFSQPPPRQSATQFSIPPELSTITTLRASIPTRSPSDRPSREEPSAVHELPIPEIVRQRRDSSPAPRKSGEVTVVSPKPPGARKSEPPRKMAVGGDHPPRMRPVASATLPVAPPTTRRASGAISEQSLDDVILSCLDDELDGSRR